MSAAAVVAHVKSHGHKWVTGLTFLVFVGYILFAIGTDTRMDQAVGKAVVVIVAALTVFGGVISLVVVAATDDKDLGELKELKQPVTLGLLVGVAVSILAILSTFGIVKV